MSDEELDRRVDALAVVLRTCVLPSERRSARDLLRDIVREATRDVCTCCPAGGLHLAFCPKSEYPGVLENDG